MAAVQGAFIHGFKKLEGRNNRTGWQNFNLEFAARHGVYFAGKVIGVFVEDIFGGLCALKAHGGRGLRR